MLSFALALVNSPRLASPACPPVRFVVIAHPVFVSSSFISCTLHTAHCPLICTSYNVQRPNAPNAPTVPCRHFFPPTYLQQIYLTPHTYETPIRLCLTQVIFFFILLLERKSTICQHPTTRVFQRVMPWPYHCEDGDDDLMHPSSSRVVTFLPAPSATCTLCQIFLLSSFYPSYDFLVVVSRSRLLYLPMILSYKSAVEDVFLSHTLYCMNSKYDKLYTRWRIQRIGQLITRRGRCRCAFSYPSHRSSLFPHSRPRRNSGWCTCHRHPARRLRRRTQQRAEYS